MVKFLILHPPHSSEVPSLSTKHFATHTEMEGEERKCYVVYCMPWVWTESVNKSSQKMEMTRMQADSLELGSV